MREVPNSLIVKIQDGGGRHIEFRKMSIFPDWMKVFSTKFGVQMDHGHGDDHVVGN